MPSALRPSALVLFLGDIIFFVMALVVTLFLRSFSMPQKELLLAHLAAFAPLFFVWIVVYVIAGLYEGRRIILARRALSTTLLYAQTANVIIAALFFFFVPAFGISPKTVLLIYLVVSFLFVLMWRALLFPKLGLRKDEAALVIGEGPEAEELVAALRSAPLSPVAVVKFIRSADKDILKEIREAVAAHRPRFVIIDPASPALSKVFPELYNLAPAGVRFIDVRALYEDVFGRVPLSSVDERWAVRTASRRVHMLYDPMKRLFDLVVALCVGLVSLIAYPFIILAIIAETGRPVFISQERVGRGGKPIRLSKFRTMTGNDNGVYQGGVSTLRVTRAGSFLRATRLDELPQLWNVLAGDLSLIGPRPEFPALVAEYEKKIPYYGLRHFIKPGLSGWAQIYHENHPHHGTDVEATREKLSYDLYYLKHRSFVLDVLIGLKTIAKMLTKSGV